ncbi:MAG: hypothetical protein WBY94_01760 [Polyangiaceae bacterium]
MDLHADARIPFPRSRVFAAYRDDIAQLLPYLPNVRSIEVKSRKDDGPVAYLVNEWRGGGDIPAALRTVLGDSMLSWTDYATWNADSLRCDWRTETHAFGDALRCAGYDLFREDGPDTTLLEIRGTLEVDARRMRGVPGFLAAKVGRGLEEFLGAKIQANLVETAKGLTQYLGKKS